jgi:hypothetical protein
VGGLRTADHVIDANSVKTSNVDIDEPASSSLRTGLAARFYLLSIWSWLGNGVPLCQGRTWPNWTSSP